MEEYRQQKHTHHAPSTKTECDNLNGWTKKNGHIRKKLTKEGEPHRYSWGTQKKKNIIIIAAFGPCWSMGRLQELSRHPDSGQASQAVPRCNKTFLFQPPDRGARCSLGSLPFSVGSRSKLDVWYRSWAFGGCVQSIPASLEDLIFCWLLLDPFPEFSVADGLSHISDLKTGTLAATLAGAWHFRVRAELGLVGLVSFYCDQVR